MTYLGKLISFVLFTLVVGKTTGHVCSSSFPPKCTALDYDKSQSCQLKRYSIGPEKCKSGRPTTATHCSRNSNITVPCKQTVASILKERIFNEKLLRLLFKASKKLHAVLYDNGWMDCDLPQGKFPDIFPRLLNSALLPNARNNSCDKFVDVGFVKGKLAKILKKRALVLSDRTAPSGNRSILVTVPPAAWANTNYSVVSVVFYNNSHFFPSKQNVQGITSVKVGSAESIGNLTQDLTIEFRKISTKNNKNLTCVYWVPSKSTWSTEGCWLNDTGEFPICYCNHLTNFGLLLNPRFARFMPGLSTFSIIGCIVSIVFFALTIITHTISRETRKRRPVKILINICITLMISMIIFVAGVERTKNKAACIAVTFMLHYFLLSGWCWMSVYSYEIYHSLVKVFRLSQRRYMQKASIIAYGLPLIISLLTIIISNVTSAGSKSIDCVGKGQYRAVSYCWLGCNSLYFGFLMPVGVMLLFNLGVFVAVIVELNGVNKKVHCPLLKRSSMQALVLAFTVTSINGITWSLGMLQLISTNFTYASTMMWLFVVTSSTQGLFVFLFTSIRPEETRHAWMSTVRNWCSSVKRAVQWESKDSSSLTVSRPVSTGQSNVET